MLKTKTLHLYYWAYMHMQANSWKDAVVFFIFDVETQMHADTICMSALHCCADILSTYCHRVLRY